MNEEESEEIEYCYSTLDHESEEEDISFIDYDMRQADLGDAYEQWEEHSRQIILTNTINKMLKKQIKTERRKYLRLIDKFLKS